MNASDGKYPPACFLKYGFDFLWVLAVYLILNGCVHPISSDFRAQMDSELTFTEIVKSPDSYVGKKIILGGTIVTTRNLADVSEVEVVQKQLDASGYPYSEDLSDGRFIFRKSGYLESEIYANGRRVTGAGTVVGSKLAKVGDSEYRFPVVEVEELYLWAEQNPYGYNPYYWGGYWGPYYPGYFYPYRWRGYPVFP